MPDASNATAHDLLGRRCTVRLPTRTASRERSGRIVGVGLPMLLIQLHDPPPALFDVGGRVVRALEDVKLHHYIN